MTTTWCWIGAVTTFCKVFQHFCLKLVYFPAIFLKPIYHFPAQKHKKHIKFQHTSSSILLPMPTPKISISGILTIINIGLLNRSHRREKIDHRSIYYTITKYYICNICKKQPLLYDFTKLSIKMLQILFCYKLCYEIIF